MNKMSLRKLFLFSLLILLPVSFCEAQTFDRPAAPKQQNSVSKKPMKQKKDKVKGPKSVKKIQKKQDAKEKKQDKDYEKFVKYNKKRSYEIQTADVKERMKQNAKDSKARDKAKKKNNSTRTKQAGRKYK